MYYILYTIYYRTYYQNIFTKIFQSEITSIDPNKCNGYLHYRCCSININYNFCHNFSTYKLTTRLQPPFVLGYAYHLINISKISETSSIRGRRNMRQKRAGTVLWLRFLRACVPRKQRTHSRLEEGGRKKEKEKKRKVSCVASASLCARTRRPCTGTEWKYWLVLHVEWRTNGFDVKNERAFLLFPRRVTVVFLTA